MQCAVGFRVWFWRPFVIVFSKTVLVIVIGRHSVQIEPVVIKCRVADRYPAFDYEHKWFHAGRD